MTRLAPFSRTTRSSFGRLNAAVWTPRLPSPAAKISLTTTMGASAPSFGLRCFRIDGQVVLDVLQFAREPLELRAFRLVSHGDVGLERRLEVEQLVLVDLVRTDGRFDRALAAPSTRRRSRSSRSRGTRRRAWSGSVFSVGSAVKRGRLAQQRRRARQLGLVLDVVRHERRTRWPSRRTTVKKPLARARSASGSDCIQRSSCALVAPSG